MKPSPRTVHIIGGGTVSHIRSHLAVTAAAYGNTARTLLDLVRAHPLFQTSTPKLHLTRMANSGLGMLETPEDVEQLAKNIANDMSSKVVFFNPAIVDFDARVEASPDVLVGKYGNRLDSAREYHINLHPRVKILTRFRQLKNKDGIVRKDILLVAFKTTCAATPAEMYRKGLKLLKNSSANLVLVNDVLHRDNMIITPEEAVYHHTHDRLAALTGLVDIAAYRSQLTFTQSTVIDGKPVPWHDDRVPDALRRVVDHCIAGGAYKEFEVGTVGHFACKLDDNRFLTSIRKSNFNDLHKVGLVEVVTDGPDTVLAYGAKPSVGGQSQRMVFRDHPGFDCVVHFHCPFKESCPHDIPVVSQREVECGSHQCGQNTSNGLRQFGNLKCVMLDNHGPNIVFPKSIDPQEVIDFIDASFDLSGKSGGSESLLLPPTAATTW